jgi:hypothetical protein
MMYTRLILGRHVSASRDTISAVDVHLVSVLSTKRLPTVRRRMARAVRRCTRRRRGRRPAVWPHERRAVARIARHRRASAPTCAMWEPVQGAVRAQEPRTLAGLMHRFSRGKHGESASPVAAPAPALTDSLARAVALGADMPAEEVEPTRLANAPRHPPHKAAPTRPRRRVRTRCSSTWASPRSSRGRSCMTRTATWMRVCHRGHERVRRRACSPSPCGPWATARPGKPAGASSAQRCRVHRTGPTLAHPRRL